MRQLFKNKPRHQLSIGASPHRAPIHSGQTILEAAISAGIKFPNMCNVGECGSCRCQLRQGQVKLKKDLSHHISQSELEQGYVLACQTQAHSDIEVLVPGLSSPTALENVSISNQRSSPSEPSKPNPLKFEGVIRKQQALTSYIQLLELELDTPISFIAGQYAQLWAPELNLPRARHYSFAHAADPNGSRHVQFFVRHVPNGEFTDWLFSEDRRGKNLTVQGPYGDFHYRAKQADSMVCVAAGSGLAPFIAMFEAMKRRCQAPEVRLIIAAKQQQDLFCMTELRKLAETWPRHFEIIPVLSQEPESSNWNGRRGRVQTLLSELQTILTRSDAYLCGPPAMLDSLINDIGSTLPASRIHFDRFHDQQSLSALRNTNNERG